MMGWWRRAEGRDDYEPCGACGADRSCHHTSRGFDHEWRPASPSEAVHWRGVLPPVMD